MPFILSFFSLIKKNVKLLILFLNILFAFVLIILINYPTSLYGEKNSSKILKPSTTFIENKGQLIDLDNNPNPYVLYLLNTPGFNVQLRKGGFSYDVYSVIYDKPPQAFPTPWTQTSDAYLPGSRSPDMEDRTIKFHRIDFDLVDANPDCEIMPAGQSAEYWNYYTAGSPEKGAALVHSYSSVTYRNIYKNIDLEFALTPGLEFKYTFIIHPGGNLKTIRIKISGANEIQLRDNGLVISTSMTDIEETIPYTYYLVHDIRNEIKSGFHHINENIYGLTINQIIPQNASLIIDPVPNRLWGTYFGGDPISPTANDHPTSITIDKEGNLVFAGYTASLNNIATAGSYQSELKGSNDAYLTKFTPDGVQIWGTYFGGEEFEDCNGCITDSMNNIFITGMTLSPTNIATPGTFQPALDSANDAYIAKFDPDGFRIWGTYYGGKQIDGANSIALDPECNVYITGKTNSSNNMASLGAHQTSYGGNTDAFLAKFDSTGQRIWGTYYGGQELDNGMHCSIDGDGHLILCGSTSSLTSIATPGAHQPVYGGGSNDAFLALFNNSGQLQWGTYYGGTGGDGSSWCLISNTEKIYLSGSSFSSDNIATPASFQSILAGGTDVYLAKFNLDGFRIWGTYFGGLLNDWISGVDYDPRGALFLCGTTISADGIATPDAFQTTYGGMWDAYMAKFDTNGFRVWCTYYGGPQRDDGNACIVDTNDRQYLVGQTVSDTCIATPGSHQYNHAGGLWDGFLVKLTDCTNPVPGPITGPSDICLDTTGIIYSIPPIPKVTNYTWTVPSGAVITAGQNTDSIIVDFPSSTLPGDITVFATNHCGTGDTAILTITLHPHPVPSITGIDSLCTGTQSSYFTESGNSFYQWEISLGNSIVTGGSYNDTSATAIWNTTGNQWIQVNYMDTNGCEAASPTQFDVEVTPGDTVNVSLTSITDSICHGSQITFTANSLNTGLNPLFQWIINGVDTNHSDSVLTYIPTQTDTVFCVVTSFEPCRSNNPDTSNTQIIHVFPILPVSINISASENPVCIDDTVTFTGVSMNGGLIPGYQWHINGNPVGTNDSNYSCVPSNGDQVLCVLTSSEQCTSNNPATSDTITVNVNPLLPVGISISASNNPVCEGLPVIFNATPINGGANPEYQWQVNGMNTGTNNSGFTYTPADGDLVTCTLTSNTECVTNNPTTSNAINISVGEAPDVSFAVCFDTITTLNAKPFKLKGGIPLGGTYSGPGVDQITGYFNPAMAGVGVKTINYSYTNQYACSNNATRAISVINPAPLSCGDSLTDIRDNRKYPTVQIGSQCWLAVNLNHGQQIGGSSAQRDNCLVEKYCYNDLSINCTQYGALYQWDELMRYEDVEENQGLCPPGWHVPSEADWNQLFTIYQGNAFAGSPLLYTGYSGFNVLLAGVEFFNQSHRFADFASIMWSSTFHGPYKAWSHGLNEYNYSVSYYPSYRSNAFAVRCVRE